MQNRWVRLWFGVLRILGMTWLGAMALGQFVPWPAYAQSADIARDYGCNLPLQVGVVEFGSMFHVNEQGEGHGVDIDIIGELQKRTGCMFEVTRTTRAQLWALIEAGKLDLATNSISTPDRAKLARFVTYFGFKNMMVMPSDQVGNTFSLQALVAKPDWRLGLVRGFRYGNYYDYNLKLLSGDDRITFYPTQQALFDGLRHGEVAAILAPSIHYFFYLNPDERQHFSLINASPAPPTPSGIAFSRTKFNAAQINNWLRVFEAMRLDRTLHRFITRHVSAAAARTMIEY